jgi:hypothetical protein
MLAKQLLFNFIALSSIAVCLYAEEKMPTYDKGHAIKETQIPSAYNHPARIDTTGCNIFISGSAIYWQGIEDGLDLGHYYYTTQTSSSNGAVIPMNYKYNPGFKVMLGTKLDHDNWILFTEYTWLHFTNTQYYLMPASSDTLNVAQGWFLNDISGDSYARWKFRYDMIDLDIARPFYLGTCLVLNPFAALRGGLIKQYYYYKYALTENLGDAIDDPLYGFAFTDNFQKSWLLGPMIGVNCDWIFFDYFRFIANGSISILYQHFNNTGKIGSITANTEEEVIEYARILTDKTNQLTPNFNGAIGLGWGAYYGKDNSWHFDLAVLYEVHQYWNQNKMRILNQKMVQELITSTVTNYVYSPTYKSEDVMLHGLTLTARFDF